jgi:hypothetical protein
MRAKTLAAAEGEVERPYLGAALLSGFCREGADGDPRATAAQRVKLAEATTGCGTGYAGASVMPEKPSSTP